ncbi:MULTISPECIES: glycerate kinase [Aerosakkonema]|uniref:glycerate kinase n=1 Tax=Aerosakkonema TaxID=1246629 RepID=UPI0035B6B341
MVQDNSYAGNIFKYLTSEECMLGYFPEKLAISLIEDELRAKAFGITPENTVEEVRLRSHLFQSVCSDVTEFCQNKGFKSESVIQETLWNLWLPLAMQLAEYRQHLGRPLIQGILGGQGTGKTTLAAILKIILAHLGYRTLGLSLDDLYKTYAERLRLQEEDPRLIWRGPPGTHDVELGIAVLDKLRQQQGEIEIPRFDKSAWGGSGDRTQPETVENVDIVLFEGWFVGVRPIDPAAFDTAPPPIVTEADRRFARDMNAKLEEYLPLWERLDRLMVLYPTDYRLSQQWRRQAEQLAKASGKSGMTDEIVDRFVEYFWRSLHPDLFIKPLARNPNWVNLVIEINQDRSLGAVYRPSDRLT